MQPKVLGTVTVDAQYIPIEIKGDTIEYDDRAFEIKEQDMVEDLLEQLPGVEVWIHAGNPYPPGRQFSPAGRRGRTWRATDRPGGRQCPVRRNRQAFQGITPGP